MQTLLKISIIIFLHLYTQASFSQTKWFKYEGNPVLDVGPPGSWDATWVHIDRVIQEDSIYRMWYTAGDTSRIGHATSSDGIRWTKDTSNPILKADPGSWEINVHRGYVVSNGSQYYMWYTGDDWSTFHIDFASSTDGIVWQKLGRPVISPGLPTSWDKDRVGSSSIVGPDESGEYKMWYDGGSIQYFGYATATDETTWTKYPDPVFWDDDIIYYDRVIFNNGLYEMWYSIRRPPGNALGYATSLDGINWKRSPESPVLHPGPDGTWDDYAIGPTGDIIFDGTLYNMWYTGNDGSEYRGGYAVSPKNIQINISPSYGYLIPKSGAVRIEVKLENPTGLSFFAKIKAPKTSAGFPEDRFGLLGLKESVLLELFDDGLHGDSLARDNVYANSWIPVEERLFFVDLILKVQRNETLNFEMNKATVFTTIGPIQSERVEFLPDNRPNPGDTVLVKLTLRNDGSSAIAHSVTASLTSDDPAIREISQSSHTFGAIIPGYTATTPGYFRIVVSPYAPSNTNVKMDITISSWGIELWHDSFTLQIVPPWWRTNWSYAGYAIIFLLLLYTLWQFEKRRTRLKHQRELEHLETEKLREVDQLKSNFFANISHEFRTPLTLILGPAEKILSKSSDKDITKEASFIKRNSKRLLQLVNQLLDLSKLDSGRLKLEASLRNIVTFVKGAALSFESLSESKDIMLKIKCSSDLIEVYFDRDKMMKIMSNLLSNAFKFTPVGGKVSISIIEASDNTVEIKIRNTGIAIAKEELPKLFDRFYQVDSSQTKEHQGTGIGLALTKELVELHHGSIRVDSEIGKWTEFTIDLPLGREHLKDGEIITADETIDQKEIPVEEEEYYDVKTIADTDADTDASKTVILVVEDNYDMREYIKESLGGHYEVEEAVNGEQGVRIAEKTIPDLIISDLMMPKMDGNELTRILKNDERTSHIPVIILTAKSGQENKIEGLETGADDYLTKPFDIQELKVRVENLINIRKKLQEKFSKIGSRTSEIKEKKFYNIDEKFMLKVGEVIEKHISEEEFDIQGFCKEVAMSRSHLHKKLKALTGKSTSLYIRAVKMMKAKKMIEDHTGNISEIAYSLGFSSPAYFSRCFKEEFGYPPSEVIK